MSKANGGKLKRIRDEGADSIALKRKLPNRNSSNKQQLSTAITAVDCDNKNDNEKEEGSESEDEDEDDENEDEEEESEGLENVDEKSFKKKRKRKRKEASSSQDTAIINYYKNLNVIHPSEVASIDVVGDNKDTKYTLCVSKRSAEIVSDISSETKTALQSLFCPLAGKSFTARNISFVKFKGMLLIVLSYYYIHITVLFTDDDCLNIGMCSCMCTNCV
jgi:hypothetical protein